eukprot:scaffold49402_cov53-Attheya_sp.AAC.1
MSIPYVPESNNKICAATQKSTVCTERYPHHHHLSSPCRCGRHYLHHPSVTMDMTEQIVVAGNNIRAPVKLTATAEDIIFPAEERKIAFKCVYLPFFTEFDGEWRVQDIPNPTSPNQPLTSVSYIVDV